MVASPRMNFWRGSIRVLAVALFWGVVSSDSVRALDTENVILFTADGIRVQEFFAGVDPMLLKNKKESGLKGVARTKRLYWRETARERREALFPFLWGELAQRGIVFGNAGRGSKVVSKNGNYLSFPGYAEMLTGRPIPSIKTNLPVRIPRATVLEYVRKSLGLKTRDVAAFCSWGAFNHISAHKEGSIFVNAGYARMPPDLVTDRTKVLNDIQMDMMTPWDSARHDTVTFGLALDYLRTQRPTLMFIALDETDDWAHERRYDRVLHGARLYDDALRDLFAFIDSDPHYSGRTTVIIATDHGRGVTKEDWTSHAKNIPGSEDIWIGVFGPDTPRVGEASSIPTLTQGQIASTILKFLGLDYLKYDPKAAPPIDQAFSVPS